MDDLPKELKFLVFDYLHNIDFEKLEKYDYMELLLNTYVKIYFHAYCDKDIATLEKSNNLKRLKVLYIQVNFDDTTKIKFDNIVPRLKNLRVLVCRGQCGLLQVIPKLRSLIFLDIRHSTIREISRELVNLIVLNCYDSLIREIPKELVNLTHLVCSLCHLTEIPKTLTNLICLDFSGCRGIKEIPRELINLEILICSYSGIRIIPKELTRIKHCTYNRWTQFEK